MPPGMPPTAMVLLVSASVRPFDAMNGMLFSSWPSAREPGMEDGRCAEVKKQVKSTPTEQEEVTDEVHAVDAADGARHARRTSAAAADRTEQRTISATAGGGSQARGVCRRGWLRRLRDNRAPLPFGRL